MEWRRIEFEDIPSREEFEQLTLSLMTQGMTNSDEMRDKIRRDRKLILKRATGNWNADPKRQVRKRARLGSRKPRSEGNYREGYGKGLSFGIIARKPERLGTKLSLRFFISRVGPLPEQRSKTYLFE